MRWSRSHDSRSRTGCGVGRLAGEKGGELGLAAGSLEVDDKSPSNRRGGTVSVVVGDEGQREVDAGGDAGRGPHVAVADVDGVGVDGDTLVAVLEEPARVPVSGRPTTLQQAGGGEDEGAGADRGDATCIGGEPTHVMKQLLIQDRGVHARTAGHDQRVDGADDVADGTGGKLQATAGHHRTATSGDDLACRTPPTRRTARRWRRPPAVR